MPYDHDRQLHDDMEANLRRRGWDSADECELCGTEVSDEDEFFGLCDECKVQTYA